MPKGEPPTVSASLPPSSSIEQHSGSLEDVFADPVTKRGSALGDVPRREIDFLMG